MSWLKGKLYRMVMKLAHHYHWHYAPPHVIEGDMQLWCQWCGLRYTSRRRGVMGEKRIRPAFHLDAEPAASERQP